MKRRIPLRVDDSISFDDNRYAKEIKLTKLTDFHWLTLDKDK